MDSTRPIPFQAAVAYGMKPQQATVRAGSTIKPPIAKASPAAGLVSGKVDSPISRGQGFETPRAAPGPNASGNLQMYSRAADRVEVATATQLGRILDARG